MRNFRRSLLLLIFLPVFLHGQVSPTILLSQSQLQFTAVAGGGILPPQNVAVLSIGGGTVNWTATASTLSGGAWLSVSPASGSSGAGATSPPQLDVQVNVAGLAPGVYFGNVRVDAEGVANSPFFVSVSLNLLPPGSSPGVLVRPTGLVFVQPAGGAAPAAQTVRLTSTSSSSLEAVANASTFAGGAWLTSTRTVTLSPGSPQTLSVQLSSTSLTSLAPDQYFGAVSLLFGDRTSAAVNVLLLVAPAASTSCVPQKLVLADDLGSNFAVLPTPPHLPTPLQTQVKDDCGNPITNATVSASFSNSNPTLQLPHVSNGLYRANWSPSGGPAVTVTVQATRAGLTPVQVQRQGQIGAGIAAGAIVNGPSGARDRALAPGEFIQIYGGNLDGGCGFYGAYLFPLPTTLGCVSVLADGQAIPLFYVSPFQINAQLPFELKPGTSVKVVARFTSPSGDPDTVSLPVTIRVGDSDPGIFSFGAGGTGQGAILNADDYTPAAQEGTIRGARPAARGDAVVIIGTGLGRTDPEVGTGQQTPGPAKVLNSVQVTIGGAPSEVLYAGLAPGYVGVYQINARVPLGIIPGPAVPVVITQKGLASNTVRMAVR